MYPFVLYEHNYTKLKKADLFNLLYAFMYIR